MSDTSDTTTSDPDDTRPKVLFAVMSAGSPRLSHVESVISIMGRDSLGPDLISLGVAFHQSGPYLDMGRNNLTAECMARSDFDWLIYVDDDIQFTPEAASTLVTTAIAHDRHLACGPYASYDPVMGKVALVAYQLVPYDPTHHTDAQKMSRFVDGRFFHPIPADATPTVPTDISSAGAGFMAVSRHLLTEMAKQYAEPQPWWAVGPVPGFPDPDNPSRDNPVSAAVNIGEDHYFCLRAQAGGHRLLLVPDARVTHIKQMYLPVPDPSHRYDPDSPTLTGRPMD